MKLFDYGVLHCTQNIYPLSDPIGALDFFNGPVFLTVFSVLFILLTKMSIFYESYLTQTATHLKSYCMTTDQYVSQWLYYLFTSFM